MVNGAFSKVSAENLPCSNDMFYSVKRNRLPCMVQYFENRHSAICKNLEDFKLLS